MIEVKSSLSEFVVVTNGNGDRDLVLLDVYPGIVFNLIVILPVIRGPERDIQIDVKSVSFLRAEAELTTDAQGKTAVDLVVLVNPLDQDHGIRPVHGFQERAKDILSGLCEEQTFCARLPAETQTIITGCGEKGQVVDRCDARLQAKQPSVIQPDTTPNINIMVHFYPRRLAKPVVPDRDVLCPDPCQGHHHEDDPKHPFFLSIHRREYFWSSSEGNCNGPISLSANLIKLKTAVYLSAISFAPV